MNRGWLRPALFGNGSEQRSAGNGTTGLPRCRRDGYQPATHPVHMFPKQDSARAQRYGQGSSDGADRDPDATGCRTNSDPCPSRSCCLCLSVDRRHLPGCPANTGPGETNCPGPGGDADVPRRRMRGSKAVRSSGLCSSAVDLSGSADCGG